MAGTVLTVSSRALLASCETLGIDTAAILAAADVDRAVIDDPDGRLPAERVAELWRRTYQASGDADLASFHHAFRRWTGKAPIEYRKQG